MHYIKLFERATKKKTDIMHLPHVKVYKIPIIAPKSFFFVIYKQVSHKLAAVEIQLLCETRIMNVY